MGLPIRVERTASPKPRTDEASLGFGIHFSDHMFVAEYEDGRGYLDPRVVPYGPLTLDPAACVFHYGQAMFDGLKAFRGVDGGVRMFRVARHCQRMSDGAARLCMPAVDPTVLAAGLDALCDVDRDWVPSAPGTALYLRPTLIATEPFLGVRPAKQYTLFVIASPVGAYYAEGLAPIRIWVEKRHVRAARGGLGAVKAGANYAASLLAAEEAKKRGYAQVLWLDANEHRYLEEVGTMNLFLRIGEELVTPPLEGTILAGVTRDTVITLARTWGLRVSERAISIDEVREAASRGSLKEVFGSGTAAVISAVAELGFDDGRVSVGDGGVGELARRLYDTITGLQYGTIPDTYGFITEVARK